VLTVAGVDLDQCHHGPDVVGDFRSMIESHQSKAEDLPE
jgi:hypothetical protein